MPKFNIRDYKFFNNGLEVSALEYYRSLYFRFLTPYVFSIDLPFKRILSAEGFYPCLLSCSKSEVSIAFYSVDSFNDFYKGLNNFLISTYNSFHLLSHGGTYSNYYGRACTVFSLSSLEPNIYYVYLGDVDGVPLSTFSTYDEVLNFIDNFDFIDVALNAVISVIFFDGRYGVNGVPMFSYSSFIMCVDLDPFCCNLDFKPILNILGGS